MAAPPIPTTLLLRVLLSCRKLTAQVTNPTTDSIITLSSSTEPDFAAQHRAKLIRFPRSHNFIDHKIASKIGEKLAQRLRDIGVEQVKIDVDEELVRPVFQRRVVAPLFAAVQEGGVRVHGAEKLPKLL